MMNFFRTLSDLLGAQQMKHTKTDHYKEICAECNLWMCHHRRPNELVGASTDSSASNLVALGEEVASDIGTRIRVSPSAVSSTATDIVNRRTLIPPPAPIVLMKDNTTTTTTTTDDKPIIGAVGSPHSTSTKYAKNFERTFGTKASVAINDKEWLTCKVCDKRANIKYFDEHIKMHTAEFADPSLITRGNGSTTITQKSAITALANVPVASSKPEPTKPAFPKVSSIEKYKFKKIERAVAIASTSVSKRYSDFTVVFLLENKPSAYSTSYATGSSASLFRDFERMSVHVVYDSVDDFYMVSSKLLKRNSHSSYDSEDAQVPERICYQEEILGEVRKAMLFLGIDPKSAYRHFRRMLRDEVIDEVDDDDRLLVSKTAGFADFVEAMKKNAGNNSTWNYNREDMFGYG